MANFEKKAITVDNTTADAPNHYHFQWEADASAEQVFDNINNVAAWWNDEMTGSAKQLNDLFSVKFGDIHLSTQKVVGFEPPKRIEWLVTHSQLNFISDKAEWTDTRIVFEIFPVGNKTTVLFTHIGLQPRLECYNSCSKGWDYYLKESLLPFLNGGEAKPGLK